jgi:hypothetical protein
LPDSARSWSCQNHEILDAVVAAFVGDGEWPERARLQRELATQRTSPPALTSVFAGMPRVLGFLNPPGDRIVLTVFGLERTTLGRLVLEGFVTALRLSVTRYQDSRVEPLLSWKAVVANPELSVKLWRATGEVLLREAPFLGNGTGDHHGEWVREVREEIVRYWDVETVEQYLCLRAEELRPLPQLGWSSAWRPAVESILLPGHSHDNPPARTIESERIDDDARERSARTPVGISIALTVLAILASVAPLIFGSPVPLTSGVIAASITAGFIWRKGFVWPPKLRALATVLGVTAMFVAGPAGAMELLDRGKASPTRAASGIDAGLAKAETPLPGHASPTLGYGDAVGGREIRPYTGNTPTAATPLINSFVDVRYDIFDDGDERRYMAAASAEANAERPEPIRFSRIATLAGGQVAWVRAVIDNNAAPVEDCENPQGSAVALNTRLRATVWSSEDAKQHVIRTWISSSNAQPHWVTDAVLIRSERPAQLVLDMKRSDLYQAKPVSALDRVAKDIFEGGGMAVGTEGRVGSCWENRVLARLVFVQK